MGCLPRCARNGQSRMLDAFVDLTSLLPVDLGILGTQTVSKRVTNAKSERHYKSAHAKKGPGSLWQVGIG